MNTARMRGRRQGMKLWHVSEAELLTYLLTYFLIYSTKQSPYWEANRFSAMYTILRMVSTQHTSRQDAIITIGLYLATCFGRNRPTKNNIKVQ